MISPLRLLIGFFIALFIALAARRARSLNRSGMWGALILGTVVMGLGGFGWAVVLMGFFLSSSLLSRMFRKQKAGVEEKYQKSGNRDAGQVLANGGIAGLFVLLHLFFPGRLWPWLGFAAAFAAANADTWATELGVLSKKPPRLITTLVPVEPGTSGGITIAGTLASLSGSAFIGLLAVLFWQGEPIDSWFTALLWLTLIAIAGLFGSLVDSVLGATAQAIYFCPVCKTETEKFPLHACGTSTHLLRGQRWLTNDWVNTFCTLSSALLIIIFSLAL